MPEVLSPPESNRPAVLLDIDGVLQVYSEVSPEGYVPEPEYPWLAYNPLHGNWLRTINDLADIYYVSDWRGQAHDQIGRRLQLPEFDWINNDPYRHERSAVARALAATALFENRPLVWIDDELGSSELQWAHTREKQFAPTLLVKTEREQGLTYFQFNLILGWLQTVVS